MLTENDDLLYRGIALAARWSCDNNDRRWRLRGSWVCYQRTPTNSVVTPTRAVVGQPSAPTKRRSAKRKQPDVVRTAQRVERSGRRSGRVAERAGAATGGDVSKLERETGFEPATSTMARSHSPTELFPLARKAKRTIASPEQARRRGAKSRESGHFLRPAARPQLMNACGYTLTVASPTGPSMATTSNRQGRSCNWCRTR